MRTLLVVAALGLLCTTVLSKQYKVNYVDQLLVIFNQSEVREISDEITIMNPLDFSGRSILPLGVHGGSCTPFSGTLNGNRIQNLVMDNTDKEYNNAGLFCKLKGGATITGLTLDETCKFTGVEAGAISVSVTGPVNFSDVKVEAEVHGSNNAGGFVASVKNLEHGEQITIRGSESTGRISRGFGGNQYGIGGFVGIVTESDDAKIIVDNSRFEGRLTCETSSCNIGGFIGLVQDADNVDLEFTECKSVAPTTCSSSDNQEFVYGGFVGSFQSFENLRVLGTNITLDGMVKTISQTSKNIFGGFAGRISSGKTTELALKQVMDVKILDATCKSLNCGGLIGELNKIKTANVTIEDVHSKAVFQLEVSEGTNPSSGGFIGFIEDITTLNVSIADSTCEGRMTTLSNKRMFSGGAIGLITETGSGFISLNNVTQNGTINVNNGYGVGGFIGGILATSTAVTVTGCTLGGMITSDNADYLSGVVGTVQASNEIKVEILDSTISGNISSKDFECRVCGFFSLYRDEIRQEASFDVHNCAIKGSITGGDYVYGVSNTVTNASNIVNMAPLNIKTPFWDFMKRESVDSLYALESACPNNKCDDKINQIFVDEYMTYFTADGQYLDEQLNQNAIKNNRTRFWTSEICLVPKIFNISLRGELHRQYFVGENDTLETVRLLAPFWGNPRFVVLENNNEVNKSTVVTSGITLTVQRLLQVQIGTPINKFYYAKPHDKLGTIVSFSFDDYVVVNKNTKTEVNASFEITEDVNISLCHNVVANSAVNGSWLPEHGSALGSIADLTPFLSNASYRVTTDNNKTKCNAITVVQNDMNVTVSLAQTGNTNMEVIIGGDSGLTSDEVEGALKDSLGDSISDIKVVENEDGDFVVSIVVAKDTVTDVKSILDDCAMHSSTNTTSNNK